MTDLYRVLQVDPAADAEVVEAAYRRLARKFHPDVSPHADAEERIRQLNAAYEVLGDPFRRSAYDAARAPRPPRHTPVRVVPPRARTRTPRPAAPSTAAPLPASHRRSVLAFATGGLASSVALAALVSHLFSAAPAPSTENAAAAVVVVSSPREEPAAAYEPVLRRPTPTASGWPPPIYVVGGTEGTAAPAVDLFSRFVGAARQATRRLQGPTPPERPYNPISP